MGNGWEQGDLAITIKSTALFSTYSISNSDSDHTNETTLFTCWFSCVCKYYTAPSMPEKCWYILYSWCYSCIEWRVYVCKILVDGLYQFSIPVYICIVYIYIYVYTIWEYSIDAFGLWSRDVPWALVYKYNESCASHNITSLLALDLD